MPWTRPCKTLGQTVSGSTEPHRVLIAGGGVAALEAALALRALAEKRVAVELLAPEPAFAYRPLAVAEPFSAGEAHRFELAALAGACGAALHRGTLAAVEADEHMAKTGEGFWFGYHSLLIASGAVPVPAVPGALTFRGSEDAAAFRELLAELASGAVERLVFAVPGGVVWPLPLYELALLTAAHLGGWSTPGTELLLVTHEEAPLEIFGPRGSEAVRGVLEARGVSFRGGSYAVAAEAGLLRLVPGGEIPADRVVALPRLRGAPPQGVPHDADGFVPTDLHGHADGLMDVYAAGDATAFPVKQGGIAAQQAQAAAESIAAAAGAPVTPAPFRPVLRGLLLTGGASAFLRTELWGGLWQESIVEPEPLWWPPGKIAGHHLGPFLAEREGLALAGPPAGAVSLPIEVDLSSP